MSEVQEKSVLVAPRLGAYWEGQGGLYAGLMPGQNGAPDYHLIAPASDLALNKSVIYGSYGIKTPGADSKFDGFANTQALLASGNDHPLAKWASELEIDGFSDLFVPSIMEEAMLRVTVPDLFGTYWYWSSTQFSAINAWSQYFHLGLQYTASKGIKGRVRAVRRLVIQ